LGGDDNAYDYHPAGMDLLRSYAEDLDASAPASFSKDFYAHQAMKVYLNVCDHVFREAILRYRKDEPDLMSRGDSLNLKHWIELDCPETLEQIAKDLHNTHPSRLALIIDQLEHTHS
jgi:tRNA splicing ligase